LDFEIISALEAKFTNHLNNRELFTFGFFSEKVSKKKDLSQRLWRCKIFRESAKTDCRNYAECEKTEDL
jgi:hypothetical protein